MSEIFKFCDPMMILANYKNPERHKHLASHIIISLGGEMEWQIENKNIKCRGICIDSNIIHTGTIGEEGSIVFLFTEISRYAASIKKKYFNGNPHEVLNDDVVDRMIKEYVNHRNDKKILDAILLQQCGIDNSDNHRYEERVEKILCYISGLKSIEHSIIEDLSNQIYVSKSRLSHLFREQTGMTLHSYLAFEKLRKTYKYFCEGRNITEACMLAGFASSSHCASTCKRMFGISLRDVYKTIKE
ncbi:helix-turn-helix transcriptional regulator [Crassaminicella profunda]|uniref:helix-turn-helix transcriptional regulator n=1 Tax=Crassaminicella profunda TaxID=1286698 RepID=UPI001CA6C742|nr:helix-turn-helix transcriptional regulator [Crassaminicella profunda]QZY56841.1 helix-turn-helix domain-containing protein [Crassaminicella profunda]